VDVQTGWRWCSRCQVLVYGGSGNGVCFDDEPHYLNDSGPYVVAFGETPAGAQDGWRWCNRCQVMVYSGFGNGICHDGEPHDFTGSGAYSVPIGETPQGFQDGWRWCSRCQVLMYAGFGDGICWDGSPHYPNDSGPYSLAFEVVDKAPAPPRPQPPLVEVTEVGGQIGVVGERFTPGGRVLLSFVRGGDVKKVTLTASGDGRITHVETALDAERVGGVVVASDVTTQMFGIGRTLRSFPAFRGIDLAEPVLEPG
jgi:hypothetical protein